MALQVRLPGSWCAAWVGLVLKVIVWIKPRTSYLHSNVFLNKCIPMWTQALYRVGQFWRGLRATVTADDWQRVRRVLPTPAVPLFAAMPVDAQRHSLNVLDTLWAAGQQELDLAVAALLHDCGKVAAEQGGVKLGLWLRGPLVLLDAFLPILATRWAAPSASQGWRYALYVQREHAAIGALWAAEAGCTPLSCWLIAQHQTSAADVTLKEISVTGKMRRLLVALQRADAEN